MTEQTVPCENCGTPRHIKIIDVLGVRRSITLACSKCEQEREVRERTRNLSALLALTASWSIVDAEAEKWTLQTHPDPEARAIGEQFLASIPNPLDELLAMRDWATSGPDEHAYLRAAQRKAMRGVSGVSFIGKPGRGKSGLASAIHRELRSRGIPGCQVNVALLFDEMRDRYRDSSLGTVEQLLTPLRMTPLLTLDDLDKLHTRGSNDEILKLYGIVQRRIADQMPIIITANASLRELAQKLEGFGEDGAAILDRLAKTTPHSFTLKSAFSFRRMSGAA